MSLPKILVVEDDHLYQTKWLRDLAGRADLIQAFDQSEARKLFASHPDIKLIVMDGYVPAFAKATAGKPGEATTLGLVAELRQQFKGPILAVSSSINRELKAAGCTEVCEHKDEVPERVLKWLT